MSLSSTRRPRTTTSPNASSGRGRWSSRHKTESVLGLLRGGDLDTASREIELPAATIAGWRDRFLGVPTGTSSGGVPFLAGGQTAVASREADERDEEIASTKAEMGEITVENELLRERARRAEANHLAPAGRGRC